MLDYIKTFWDRAAQLPREELLDLLEEQDPELRKQVKRIEWVFTHKLQHLTWNDGTPVTQRPLTNQELAYLLDPPFQPDSELTRLGLSIDQQRQAFIAADPVMWARHFLNFHPRAYQILMLRWPKNRKVLRAGRRLGKTAMLAVMMLHYSYTHNHGRVLVLTPMKSQGEVIYKEMLKLAANSELVQSSITRAVTAPYHVIEFVNGSVIRFFSTGLKSGGKCLTPDHDVLTEDGWKPVADVQPGEFVLSWKDGKEVWAPVSDTWSYHFDGELVSHIGKQLSFRVTPNHRFLSRDTYEGSQWQFREATELRLHRVPTAGAPVEAEGTKFTGDELELWGWWLAEGSGFIGKMARICQVKPEGRKRIRELAHNLGLHVTAPYREIRIEWKPPIFSGTNAYDKFIPRELMDEQHRDRLLQGLIGGDGWIRHKGWEYSSSSPRLAEDVQELAVRMGIRANLREKTIRYQPVGGGLPNRHWIVSGYPYDYAYTNPKLLEREQYSGPVHCITVPDTGVFLTRHRGLVHFTGNSDVARGQEAHIIVLDELDYMGPDDLDAILAMLQKTEEGQEDKVLIGASTPTGRREKLWDWSHSDRFKEFWFPSYCFPAGTMISMADGGLKPIEDVVVGDRVFSHDGSQQQVTRLFQRKYSGPMVQAVPTGDNVGLTMTAGHPVLASLPDKQRARDRRHTNPQWTDAGDLTTNHWISLFHDRTQVDFKIDLLDLDNRLEEHIPGRVRMRTVGPTGQKVLNDFPRFVSSEDYGLAVLAGWYLAEGHVEGGAWPKVGWTLNHTEGDVVHRLQEALDGLGAGGLATTAYPDKGRMLVRVSNGPLAILLTHLCGRGSRTKRLAPEVMQADLSFQYFLLEAYLQGDGHDDGRQRVAMTTSDVLARQLKTLGARIYKAKPVRTFVADNSGGPTNRGETQSVNHVALGQQRNLGIDLRYLMGGGVNRFSFCYSKLRAVRSYEDTLAVYNFEVENTNSYIAENVVVHNCNPHFTKDVEEDLRSEYSEMVYRHEIEADWGEDLEGVYPRRWVEIACHHADWPYVKDLTSARSFFTIGVDWDKYGAGVNIVVLEVCDDNYEDERFAGKMRVAYREETIRETFTLTNAVNRVIELNAIFQPRHIYIDRGYGEVQYELLKKYGQEHPTSMLHKRVVGVSFSEHIEVRDPITKAPIKKDVKPYMVDNFRQMLEREQVYIPSSDEILFRQLIGYIVSRLTATERPVFEAGEAGDHAHDALLLACLAVTQNYGELTKLRLARRAKAVSNEAMLPTFDLSSIESVREQEEEFCERVYGSVTAGPVMQRRPLAARKAKMNRPFKRSKF